MINYFNFKKFDKDYLITNDTGKFAFVDKKTFSLLVSDKVTKDNEKYRELEEKLFITEEHKNVFAQKVSDYVAANKSYLLSSTGLFIFVVTKRCNLNCIYCQAMASEDSGNTDMTEDVAKRGVDIVLSSPSQHITIEFQGGEPLLNFDIVKYIIEYSQSIKGDKDIEYCIATNITVLNDEILEYLIKHNVSISTSVDGNESVHLNNRRCSQSVFQTTKNKIAEIQNKNHSISAIETTTRYSLNYAHEIIDEYVKMNLRSIFIRPLTKLGAARIFWEKIGYTAEEFVMFYDECLTYILQLNKQGIKIQEMHASVLLKKILGGYSDNYMELRSPCGATLGQMAFYYTGEIYTCDEGRMLAEMGNKAFLLGNVYESTYDKLIESPVCKATCSSSVLESQLNCCDCAYQPYCGTCPVINLAENHDIVSKTPKQFRCEIYGGILDILFKILKSEDKSAIEILKSWI